MTVSAWFVPSSSLESTVDPVQISNLIQLTPKNYFTILPKFVIFFLISVFTLFSLMLRSSYWTGSISTRISPCSCSCNENQFHQTVLQHSKKKAHSHKRWGPPAGVQRCVRPASPAGHSCPRCTDGDGRGGPACTGPRSSRRPVGEGRIGIK